MQFNIQVTNESHQKYAQFICELMEKAAKVRGTGIAKRKPEYIKEKMSQGNAVIALDGDVAIGFCYIESWEGINTLRIQDLSFTLIIEKWV